MLKILKHIFLGRVIRFCHQKYDQRIITDSNLGFISFFHFQRQFWPPRDYIPPPIYLDPGHPMSQKFYPLIISIYQQTYHKKMFGHAYSGRTIGNHDLSRILACPLAVFFFSHSGPCPLAVFFLFHSTNTVSKTYLITKNINPENIAMGGRKIDFQSE